MFKLENKISCFQCDILSFPPSYTPGIALIPQVALAVVVVTVINVLIFLKVTGSSICFMPCLWSFRDKYITDADSNGSMLGVISPAKKIVAIYKEAFCPE